MSAHTFVGGFGQMEALQQEQNMIGTGAAAVTVLRFLLPVFRDTGRWVLAWHTQDKNTGAPVEVDGEPDVEMPQEMAATLQPPQQPQQQHQQQEQPVLVTPSNSKVKADSSGKITINSKSLDVNAALLPKFDVTTTTTQYGPPRPLPASLDRKPQWHNTINNSNKILIQL